MSDLSVTLAGVKMRTPIGVQPTAAIAPWMFNPERYAQWILKTVDLGAGYVYVPAYFYSRELEKELEERKRKGIPPHITANRTMKMETPGFGIEGGVNIAAGGSIGWLEGAPKLLSLLRKRVPEDIPIIANLIGPGGDADGWAEGAMEIEGLGADLIELNFSSPTGLAMRWTMEAFEERKLGAGYVGALMEAAGNVEAVTKAVVKAVKVPVGVKWSAEIGFPQIVILTRKIRDAGAKFVTSVNMSIGIAPPDIYRGGKPLWPHLDAQPLAFIHGNYLRPILYKHVVNIARLVPDIDIIATGGLVTPEHFIEAMMLGAKAVGTCTGVYFEGLPLIKRSIEFFKKYMENQGYDNVDQFTGLALKYIKYPEEIDWKLGKTFTETDPIKCTGCGLCLQTLCDASYMEDGIAKVRREDCNGCGICSLTCRQGARRIVCQA